MCWQNGRWCGFFVTWAACTLLAAVCRADEGAAPSSHLVFDDNFPGDILIQEVRVPRRGEALYTYYEALGWQGKGAGYAGIQAHPDGHNYIFSIWDHDQHTAPIVAPFTGAGTRVENFGGEGTGLKSWNFDLGWEVDIWYTLVLRAWPVGDHTYFGFWVRSDKTRAWTHLVTMDVAAPDATFEGGTDAFLEDWLDTGSRARTTQLRGGWKRRLTGDWYPLTAGRYSVNSWDLEPGKRSFAFRENWNAGVAEDATGSYFFMTAGGRDTTPEVKNPGPLQIESAGDAASGAPAYAPVEVSRVRARPLGQDAVEISWQTQPGTLPQFGYRVTVRKKDAADTDEPLLVEERIDPPARTVQLKLPPGVRAGDVVMSLEVRDILDHETEPQPVRQR